MSRTDKTDPYEVKKSRLPDDALIYWRPEFGCGRSCKRCYGWWAKAEARRARQDSKRQARDWRAEYDQ